MKTKILNLKNNVKLIHTYTKDVNGVEMEFTFKAGSLNDPKGKEGLAHFCEHALINAFSTEKHTRNERKSIKKKFQYSNAYTGTPFVQFVIDMHYKDFEEAIDVLTEPFNSLKYVPEECESERKIIIDEILTRPKSNGRKLNMLMYKKWNKEKECNKMTVSAAGSVDTVKNITLDDIKNYIEKYMTQQNLIISITGHLPLRKAIKYINKYVFTRIPVGDVKGFDFENYVGYHAPCLIKDSADEEGQSIFLARYLFDNRTKFDNIKDNTTFALLSNCLQEKMFEFYRINKNLCYGCSADIFGGNIYNMCDFFVKCSDNNIKSVIDEYHNMLVFLRDNLTEELFEKHRNRIINSYNFDFSNIKRINSMSLNMFLHYNKIIKSKEEYRTFENIKFEDAKNLFEKIIKSKPYFAIISSCKDVEAVEYKTLCKNAKL